MKRIILLLAVLLGLMAPATAQVNTFGGGCVAVGGVNSVPRNGVSCPSDSIAPTYGAAGIGIVPASSATDVACITGNGTTITRVQQIRVSGTAGTLVSLPVVITKHASANTGGTAATTTALPVPYRFDPSNPAPLSTTTAYTANPTIADATPGLIDMGIVTLNATTAAGGAPTTFAWTTRAYNEAPVLRSTAQQVCVNLNAVSVSSGLLAISFMWTEQSQ